MGLRTLTQPAPERCAQCNKPLSFFFVTGRLADSGSIRDLCVTCHANFGTGLGTGHGEMYEVIPQKDDDPLIVKVWG